MRRRQKLYDRTREQENKRRRKKSKNLTSFYEGDKQGETNLLSMMIIVFRCLKLLRVQSI
jgi:hypothetical protein